MYIVVAGGGMVGGSLIKKLLDNKHDVVLIEQNKDLCEKMYAETGVITIHGSASQLEILKDAKIQKADVFIAATASDTDNLAATIMAKSFNIPNIIIRMRDINYENAYKVAGADTIVAVTELMVNRMIFEVEKPMVQKITTIGSGKADIFRIVVPENGKTAGKSIADISSTDKFPNECRFLAVYNKDNDELTISRGDHVLKEKDELFLIAGADDITTAAEYLLQ